MQSGTNVPDSNIIMGHLFNNLTDVFLQRRDKVI